MTYNELIQVLQSMPTEALAADVRVATKGKCVSIEAVMRDLDGEVDDPGHIVLFPRFLI